MILTHKPRVIDLARAGCRLDAYEWRGQYDNDDGVLVQDLLNFDGGTNEFLQNVTAFPLQDCAANTILWTGKYDLANATALLLSYIRCTPSGVGCLRCEPTGQDWATIKFLDDCDGLVLTHEDGEERTYFANVSKEDEFWAEDESH